MVSRPPPLPLYLLILHSRSAPPAQFFPTSCLLPFMFLGSSDPTGPQFNSAFSPSLLFLSPSQRWHHHPPSSPRAETQEPSLSLSLTPPSLNLLPTLAKPHLLQLPELRLSSAARPLYKLCLLPRTYLLLLCCGRTAQTSPLEALPDLPMSAGGHPVDPL